MLSLFMMLMVQRFRMSVDNCLKGKIKTGHFDHVSCQLDLADEDTCSWLFFEQNALGLEILNIDEKTISIRASFAPKIYIRTL